MAKNQVYVYNAPKISFISSNQGEISSDNEIKLIGNKNKFKNKIPNKKVKINDINNNDINIVPQKKIIDDYNKFNNKKITTLIDDNNNISEKEEKNTDIIYNKNKYQENLDTNQYKNILIKKNRNKENGAFEKRNKNNIFSEMDSVNEKMIGNNYKTKDNHSKKNINNNNYNDFDRSERRLKEDKEIKEIKEKTEDEMPEEKKIFYNNLYDKITGYNIDQEIKYDNLKLFFFNQIPENKTLSTNINVRNKEFKTKSNNNKNYEKIKNVGEINPFDLNENIKTYDYDLEILRNHQIYYFGKIINSFPYLVIKIYISDNFTKYSEINQHRVEESDFYCVGKIESNIVRNEFVIYKGNDRNKYEKILDIYYNINIFGLFGVRIMTVNKYENGQLLFKFNNELPKWDNEFKFYKLNFNGRVKMICKKNFILKQNEENILQCGKIDDNSFALDFISPLSPFESFCISITSLVNKKACE